MYLRCSLTALKGGIKGHYLLNHYPGRNTFMVSAFDSRYGPPIKSIQKGIAGINKHEYSATYSAELKLDKIPTRKPGVVCGSIGNTTDRSSGQPDSPRKYVFRVRKYSRLLHKKLDPILFSAFPGIPFLAIDFVIPSGCL